MQVSFIMSTLAVLASVASTQAAQHSYGDAEAAVKAMNPNLDDDGATEAAAGYMQALAQLGRMDDNNTDPELVARGVLEFAALRTGTALA
ncbi:hypothetical protein NQ176_g3470 [Zarea fungicola]|uniref:Uncharacterized protein n=1 Tax=Zarea fungicola TaxID=93591 RepID=A0ACC1NJM7_9HYPO|nr:hypothetical protein NQ176_g3470 [Lecanicillium fungicola]